MENNEQLMTDAVENHEQAQADNATAPEFVIQKIYVRDASFEAPNTPLIFRDQWNPSLELSLNNNSKMFEADMYEVHLQVKVKAMNHDKVAFIVEVQHVGIFSIKHFTEEQLKPMLGSYCPSIIYPYVRETIADLVSRGGFPQLNLAPVNFDALYMQYMQKLQAEQAAKPVEA